MPRATEQDTTGAATARGGAVVHRLHVACPDGDALATPKITAARVLVSGDAVMFVLNDRVTQQRLRIREGCKVRLLKE